ncbi:MAG: diguanylate cyclase [Rhizobacter sp.]|nr:diguanylate cyclase [Rhizobacter sp.]
MPAVAIDHVNIRAGRPLVAAMKAFYETVLGLRDGWRPPFASSGHWLYLGEAPVLHLVEDDAVPASAGPRGPVVDHVSFACTGRAEFEASLSARGIPFRRTRVPGTALVQLFLVDPAGNGVELQFNEPVGDE